MTPSTNHDTSRTLAPAHPALEVLEGRATVDEAARRFGMPAAELRDWIARLTAAGQAALNAPETTLTSSSLPPLLDNALDIVTLFEADGRIRAISRSVEDILGYSPDELTGTNGFDLIHPEDAAECIERFHELLGQAGATIRLRYRCRHKDGSWRWLEWIARNLLHVPGIEAIIENARDVTADEEADERLRRNEDRFRHLAERGWDVIALFNADGEATYLSESFTSAFGHSTEACLGDAWLRLIHPDDVVSVRGFFKTMPRAIGAEMETELRIRHADGSWRWIEGRTFNLLHEPGVDAILSKFRDITDRKRQDDTLRESEERFRIVIEQTGHMVYDYDIPTGRIAWQGAVETISGYSASEFAEVDIEGWEAHIHPDDRGIAMSMLDKALAEGGAYHVEYRFRQKSGQLIWIEDRGVVLTNASGAYRMIGTMHDVSVRRSALDELRDSEEKYRSLVENLNDVIFTLDTEGRFTYMSPVIERISAIRVEDIIGRPFIEFIHPDDLPGLMQSLERTLQGSLEPYECRAVDKNGAVHYMRTSSRLIVEDGEVTGLTGVMSDITAQKKAYDALEASEAKFRHIYHHAPVMLDSIGEDGVIRDVNDRWLAVMGYERGEVVGRTLTDFMAPESAQRAIDKVLPRIWARGSADGIPYQYLRKDGVAIDVLVDSTVTSDAEGRPVSLAVVRDVTDVHRLAEQLRVSEERLALTLDGAELGLWDWDMHTGAMVFNDRWATMLGYDPEELRPATIHTWQELTHPDDAPRVIELMIAHLQGQTPSYESEHRLRNKDGTWTWVLDRGKVAEWDTDGVPVRAAGTHLDITARKQAEDDRVKLEAQIQQAQKLESLGVLAGGIAHDFNNLLVGILGNADLALLEAEPDCPSREYVANVIASSQRAADLCRQMLAYSGKGRFVVQPIDINEVVHDMAHLLEVSITKSATVTYAFEESIPAVDADVTQIRQVIMNLITNASDAIGSDPGIIAIRTESITCDTLELAASYLHEELPAGRYVVLEVTDTGCGMDDDTQQRIFDPFFSTKFTGRGLGMAAVLGIVRGHKGAISVRSAPGKGTTFRVLLPVSDKEAVSSSGAIQHVDGWRGKGTILVVDDEAPVRDFARKLLERSGFEVLTAQDGEEAVAVVKQRAGAIDLVLLDMMMPVMNGDEAFRHMRALRPDLPVIVSSGYDEEEAVSRFGSGALAGFVQKPYRSSDLMQLIRKTLRI